MTLALATVVGLVGATPASAAVVLAQSFDGVAAPALPSGWTSVATNGPNWVTTTSTPDTAPNAAFAPASNSMSDLHLVTPVFVAPVNAAVTFRHKYDLHLGRDGAVLEIKIGSGGFTDIRTSGGYFSAGGYNNTINPLSDVYFQGILNGRSAWTGQSGGYITSKAFLPSSSFGQNVQLRWRVGTDNHTATASPGWWVDGVSIADDPTGAVTIKQAVGQVDPTTSQPINFSATFGRSVTGFGDDDISFAGSSAGATPTASVTGGPQTYNVAVSGLLGGQTVRVSIPANRVTGGNVASTSTDNAVTYNTPAPPTLSIANVTVTEGNSGTTPATFTITRSGSTTGASSVNWATQNNGALSPSDYVAVPATTVNFAAGETTKAVTVTVNGDTVFEANENFYVLLSAPTGATITNGVALGYINNDDAGLSINDVSVAEGNSGTTPATFTITRAGTTTGASSVAWATVDYGAKAPGDYVAVPATIVNFAAGESSKTVSVSVNGDTVAEANETFFVKLSNPTGASIVDADGVGTITNDDAGLSVNDVSVVEGNSGTTTATFTITRSGLSTGASSVEWSTADYSAKALISASDYVAVPATIVNFAAGETTKTVAVTINGDTFVEPNETFFVKLSNATGATIADGSGVGTITNDDAGFRVNDVTLTEGNSGTKTAIFTISRSGVLTGPATVEWATADYSAKALISASDYVAVPATVVNFAPGEANMTVTVTVNGDTFVEPNETFFVKLSNPTGGVLVDGTGVGTITNDDTGLRINDVTVVEGNSGTTAATFTVTRSGLVTGPSTVDWATANYSAVDTSDYLRVVATPLSFAAGETTKTVTVTVNGDTASEVNETFFVRLSSPAGAVIVDGTGVGTITNDDAGLSINDASVTEGNSGTTTATFTITRSGVTTGTASVDWATQNNTATAGSDFVAVPATTVNFAAGETTKTVSVTINADTGFEPTETFYVKLSNPIGASVSRGTGVGTIVTDETGISVSDATLTEGNTGTVVATFTLTRTGVTTGASTVDWATANVNAAAGSDYVAVPTTTVSFAAGETTKTVTVTVNGDTEYESSERFEVRLTNPTGASIVDGTGVGLIFDDDTGLRVNDVTVTEGSAGTTEATFTINRVGVTTGTSSVDWATANVTAQSGSDYVAVPVTTVNFAAGETAKTVSVTINGDTVTEPAETFNVKLTNPTGATIADATGVGTILNDD